MAKFGSVVILAFLLVVQTAVFVSAGVHHEDNEEARKPCLWS